jgi:hypothetical protein
VCPIGKYQAAIGQTACEQCPGERTTETEGSTSESDCLCAPGSFESKHNNRVCLNCTDVYVKEAVSSCPGEGALPIVAPHFMTLPDSTVMYYCGKYAESHGGRQYTNYGACPGGLPVGEFNCGGVGSGIACAWCAEDYFWNVKDGLCDECSDGPKVLLIILASLAFLIIIAKIKPIEAEFSEATIQDETAVNLVSVPVAQLMDFLQMQGIWARSAIPWPLGIGRMFASMAQLFDLTAFHMPCFWSHGDEDSDARDHILALNLLPLVFIIPLYIICIPSAISKGAQMARAPDPVKLTGVINTVFLCFYTTIVSWSLTLAFATYKHPKTEGHNHRGPEESLLAYPYILTTSDQANALHVIGFASFGVWGVGIFLNMVTQVGMLTFSEDRIFHRTMLPITAKYRKHMPWWCLFEMLVKLFAVLSLTLFDEAGKQIQMMVACYAVYLVALCTYAPYRFLRHNWTDVIFTAGKILILMFSVTFYSPDVAQDPESSTLLTWILIIVYANFAWFYLTSLILFGRRAKGAAHPLFDAGAILACRNVLLFKCFPNQRHIGELIPSLAEQSSDVSAGKDAKKDEKEALLQADESGVKSEAQLAQERELWQKGIKRKDDMIENSCKLILEKIAPSKMKTPFQSLMASQKSMVQSFVNNEKSSVQSKMEEQSGLIKELLG